jgi:hypothetical protein
VYEGPLEAVPSGPQLPFDAELSMGGAIEVRPLVER